MHYACFSMHFMFPSVHVSPASLDILRTCNHGMRAHYQPDSPVWKCAFALQMTKQLENEKEKLIEKKRQEQEERQRKQLELERILEDNRRLVRALCLEHKSTPAYMMNMMIASLPKHLSVCSFARVCYQ